MAHGSGALLHYANEIGSCGYAINDRLDAEVGSATYSVYTGRGEPSVRYPALTVATLDARIGIIATRGPDTGRTKSAFLGIYRRDFISDILAQTEGAIRHSGGANYAFVDGHAKWLRPTALKKSRLSDGIHPGFGL